jgi:hypothetical protein
MWRHPSEALGHFSAAGPAPSALAGILGAAFGCKYPQKITTTKKDKKKGEKSSPEEEPVPSMGPPRPVSPELLMWLKTNHVEVACRILTPITRISTSVNGVKNIREGYGSVTQSFRLQRKSLESPEYEVLVKIKESAASELFEALQRPHFPIYLGDSNHPGKILTPKILTENPEDANWAFHSEDLLQEEYQWNTKLGLGKDRLIRDGYWNYPSLKTKSKPEFQKTFAEELTSELTKDLS